MAISAIMRIEAKTTRLLRPIVSAIAPEGTSSRKIVPAQTMLMKKN